MSFLADFKKFFVYRDLRNRALITLGLLVLVRLLAHIPLPGVDIEAVRSFFGKNQIFGLLNLFSGGTMQNFSLVLMGVAPYITASIVVQLLTMVVPSLEALSKEGEYGQRKINQYTRWLTIPMALIQSYGMITVLVRGSQGQAPILQNQLSGTYLIEALVITTCGTLLLMWIGELISEAGIGNGISLIITLGIISGIPTMVRNTFAIIFTGGTVDYSKAVSLFFFGILAIAAVAFIILINEGQRRIPVSYARRNAGNKSYGAVDSYLPIRVNVGGVIPIIFALSMVLFPSTIAKMFQTAKTQWLANGATAVANFLSNNLYYGIIYFLLVIAFTYFYSAIVFNPEKVAENLQKQSGFIPGIRPGLETQHYLARILSRVNLFGGVFLGLIAVLPFIVQYVTKIQTIVLGGTGVLIVISVILDTMRQIKSQLMMRSYEY